MRRSDGGRHQGQDLCPLSGVPRETPTGPPAGTEAADGPQRSSPTGPLDVLPSVRAQTLPLGRVPATETAGREMKRSGPIKPISKRRQGERAQRAATRAEVLRRAGDRCEAERLAVHLCGSLPGRRALEVDERHGGSFRSTEYLDPDSCQALCPIAHQLKTDNPKEAAIVGLVDIDVQDRWVLEGSEIDRIVRDALRAWATLESRLVQRRRLSSPAAFERAVSDSLPAVAEARNSRISESGDRIRLWQIRDDGRLCEALPPGPSASHGPRMGA